MATEVGVQTVQQRVSYEFRWLCNTLVVCCVLSSCRVSCRLRVRFGFSVWLVSGYAHVFVQLSAVIVTLLITLS